MTGINYRENKVSTLQKWKLTENGLYIYIYIYREYVYFDEKENGKIYCFWLKEHEACRRIVMSTKQWKAKSMVDLTLEVRTCQSSWWAACEMKNSVIIFFFNAMEKFISILYEQTFADVISCKQKTSCNSELGKRAPLDKRESELNNQRTKKKSNGVEPIREIQN